MMVVEEWYGTDMVVLVVEYGDRHVEVLEVVYTDVRGVRSGVYWYGL